jgi:hypothetical protein
MKRNEAPAVDVHVGVSLTGVVKGGCGLANALGIPVVRGNHVCGMDRLTEDTAPEFGEDTKRTKGRRDEWVEKSWQARS